MNKIYANVNEDENVDEPNFQWVVLASEAEEREAALQEELAKFKAGCVDLSSQVRELEHKMDYYKGEGLRADALQQRLTVAEQRVQRMVDCSKGQDSIATGYLSDILALLKPAAEEGLK